MRAGEGGWKAGWQALCLVILICASYGTGYSHGSCGLIDRAVLTEDLKRRVLDEDSRSRDNSPRLDAVLSIGHSQGKEADAAGYLIALLRCSAFPMVRFVAAIALGELGDQRAGLHLIAALRDSDSTGGVQVAAATALSKLKDQAAVDPLISRLADENPDVRAGAATALGILRDIRAVVPLIAALGDENPFVRFKAARALGEIRNSLAVDPLIASLRHDEMSDVRWWAVHALGQIGDPKAIQSLAEVVSLGARQTRPMADALSKETLARESFFDLIKTWDWSMQLEAIHALGKIGGEAMPPLIATLVSHPEFEFRKEAAKVMMEAEGVRFTIGFLKDDSLLRIVKGIYDRMISMGEPGTEQILINALNQYGDIYMAGDFLGSANSQLETAAWAWIRSKGLEGFPREFVSGPRWGEGRTGSLPR